MTTINGTPLRALLRGCPPSDGAWWRRCACGAPLAFSETTCTGRDRHPQPRHPRYAMMHPTLLPLLLLAAGVPPLAARKMPANPEREAELLSPPRDLDDDAPTHAAETWLRHTLRQARDIDAYIVGHEAERVDELRAHYRVLLCAVRRVEARLRKAEHEAKRATPPPESRAGNSALSIDSLQTATMPTLPLRTRPPEPAAVKVRCPRCQAKPGRRCRGRSGSAMTSPHPERMRAWERQKG